MCMSISMPRIGYLSIGEYRTTNGRQDFHVVYHHRKQGTA
jgi:hypothetical protein